MEGVITISLIIVIVVGIIFLVKIFKACDAIIRLADKYAPKEEEDAIDLRNKLREEMKAKLDSMR